MSQRPIHDGLPWTRDQLVIVFELYCRTPFQKTKASNPQVRQTAAQVRRTPAAVARKLGNLGAFDPRLQQRGITGLPHGSRLDRQVWDEFHQNWNGLVDEAYRLRDALEPPSDEPVEWSAPDGPSERIVTSRQRRHQAFFRQAVLSSYDGRCCVTGLPIEACLVASHIVPWARDESCRTDPTNGLCLSATFDRLFDAGLMTVTADLRVRLSRQLLATAAEPVQSRIVCFHDQPIQPPRRFAPSPEHLAWHEMHVFRE